MLRSLQTDPVIFLIQSSELESVSVVSTVTCLNDIQTITSFLGYCNDIFPWDLNGILVKNGCWGLHIPLRADPKWHRARVSLRNSCVFTFWWTSHQEVLGRYCPLHPLRPLTSQHLLQPLLPASPSAFRLQAAGALGPTEHPPQVPAQPRQQGGETAAPLPPGKGTEHSLLCIYSWGKGGAKKGLWRYLWHHRHC